MAPEVRWQASDAAVSRGIAVSASDQDSVESLLRRLIRRIEESERRYAEALDELHARLDPSVFWRVHRSHLVNINKIKEIVPWFSRNYILRMKDEKATEIPVSRTQTRRLREYLKL